VVVHVDAITFEQLVAYRDQLVPETPVERLVDVATTLVVDADGSVVPLTHEVTAALRLGSLFDARLASLARDWLRAGRGDALVAACSRTWAELAESVSPIAVYWYDEVGARTKDRRWPATSDAPPANAMVTFG
jgi:hypothetical protein